MEIAIISDIHDNIWKLEKVLEGLTGKVDAVICCGDYCSPFIPPKLTTLNVPIYACLGNNDEDQIGFVKGTSGKIEWTSLAEEYGTVELDGKKLAFCHYPKLGELLAGSGEFDAVFHGHTHNSRSEKVNSTLLLNPGAVCGIQKGHEGISTYAIYHTSTNTADIIEN